ncbi:MAG: RNA methyltransferase [Candidatus Aenigmatarchaeota archaeon]
MIEIIIMEPEIPGNIGAIARAMKNFGYENLLLVNPCEINQEAKNRAKHAQNVLKNAEILERDEFEWDDYNLLVGTTGIMSNEYKVLRNSITPKKLREKLSRVEGDIGIVFGREGIGLRNEELKKCDLVTHIPTSEEYPIMNLSHSVTIFLYELSQEKDGELYQLMGKNEKKTMLKVFKYLVEKVNYKDYRKDKTYQIFRNIIGRGMISKRESHTLIGFLKTLMRNVDKR